MEVDARRLEELPVVVIEANLPDSGAMSFIGFDNYQAGADTAKQMIKLGGY